MTDGAVVFDEIFLCDALDVCRRDALDVHLVVFVEAPVGDGFGFPHLHGDVVCAVAAVGHLRDDLLLRLFNFRFGQSLFRDLA